MFNMKGCHATHTHTATSVWYIDINMNSAYPYNAKDSSCPFKSTGERGWNSIQCRNMCNSKSQLLEKWQMCVWTTVNEDNIKYWNWHLFTSYVGCPRRNGQNFGRVFLMLKYTDITQNTYIQSWTVTEIMAREVWKYDSCYTLTDYQIHIKTGRNMWFL